MHYLDELNDKQRHAVTTISGPLMVVAGAGAGKTKTIAYRILHLIMQGVAPHTILAITFTNKAGKEMKDRVSQLLQTHNIHTGIPHVSTFHSLGVSIIKQWGYKKNIDRYFSIYDKSDSKKLIKKALESLHIEPKEHLDKVSSIISHEKGRGISCNQFSERASYDFTSEITKKVWHIYEQNLRKDNALDFDDLLLISRDLLLHDNEIREYYQKKWIYVHVDEYQDTNKIQDEIIELLVGAHKNICVVGDTDQTIYSWRGAEITHMLSFEKKYPRAEVVVLEQNYRSTEVILSAANTIIEKNKWRIPKKLFTTHTGGEKISLYEAYNETDEAHHIAQKAKSLVEIGVEPQHIAVLYRANFQSRALEEVFFAYGVSYHMIGTKFFERKEIKDMVSYIRAALQNSYSGDFLRIINTPPRGIGKTTIDKIETEQFSLISSATQLKIDAFKHILVDIREKLLSLKPSESLQYICNVSGMEQQYKNGTEEDVDRLENIRELIAFASRYDHMLPQDGIETFLTDVSLMSDQDTDTTEQAGVRLMTVHASKGLEFEYVFISGLEEDVFPHVRMNEKEKEEDMEEERRLFYVAITRAKKVLHISYANIRTIFGKQNIHSPSRFLTDIPTELCIQEKRSMLTSTTDSYIKIDF